MEILNLVPTPTDKYYIKLRYQGFTQLNVFGPDSYIYTLLCGYIIELIDHKHVRLSNQFLITQ